LLQSFFIPHRHTAGNLFNNLIRGQPCANADGAGHHWIDNAAAAVRVMGDEYHKLHPETQLRYLPVGTGESAKNILSGAGDLGGGDAPIPEEQLKGAAHPAVELPSVLVGIAVFYMCQAPRRAFAFRGRCLRISTLEKQPHGATRRLPS